MATQKELVAEHDYWPLDRRIRRYLLPENGAWSRLFGRLNLRDPALLTMYEPPFKLRGGKTRTLVPFVGYVDNLRGYNDVRHASST